MANIYYDPSNRVRAQRLRREMTRQERHLWYDCLKNAPVTFRRQKQFGHYIVDFYCAGAQLVVEIDGGQHYEAEGRGYDAARDAYLRSLGLRVLRFSNREIDGSFDGVRERIWQELER